MPNNIDSSTSNFSCLQYQSQQSTSANSPCQQQENPTQPASTKNERVISDTKPYTSPSSDTLKKTSRPIKEKPFECSYCDKAFIYSSDFKKHLRIHTGERPFKCTICSKSFIQTSHLQRHKRSHTGERPFKCTDCDKGFILKQHLHQHAKTHTKNNPTSNFIQQGVENPQNNQCKQQDSIDDITADNQTREFIKNYNASKKNILEDSYNSIVEQCQDKSISIEKTLVNLFSTLTKKYILNDDAQNVAKKLVSIITELPPQFKSTDCLDIREKAKIKTYTELVFILKNHTVDEFLEKYLKIETPQLGNTHTCQLTKEHGAIA